MISPFSPASAARGGRRGREGGFSAVPRLAMQTDSPTAQGRWGLEFASKVALSSECARPLTARTDVRVLTIRLRWSWVTTAVHSGSLMGLLDGAP